MPLPTNTPAPDQQAGCLALEHGVPFGDAVLVAFALPAALAPWLPVRATWGWTLAFPAVPLSRRGAHRHVATA
jgi:hypothetical protein